MTRTIKLAVAAAMALGATSAFATNGDNMIAYGAKSTAMGGTGIAYSFGAESALVNPALIGGNEVSFGGTYFAPNVKFKDEVTGMSNSFAKSAADQSVIPEVAVSSQVNEHFSWGIGMFGVAGMGVDYRNDTAMFGSDQSQYMGTASGTNQMTTNLQIMRFAVPLAYKTDGFSVGIAPVLQYGSLSIAYNNGAYFNDMSTGSPVPVNVMTGYGASQDFGFGYQIGAAYDFSKVGVDGLTLGAKYQSAIDMEYKDQISKAAQNFGLSGFDDHLEQPAEAGVGVAYTIAGSTITFDYKQIQWGNAKGYKDFDWENQNVYAVGYQYAADTWAVRAGYNYAKNPIKEQSASNMMTPGDYQGAAINYFNLAGFPAVVEQHYTIGGSYSFTKQIGVDVAYVYSPEVEFSYDTSAMTQAMAAAHGDPNAATYTSTASVKHSQQALSLQLNYKF
jgi:long-chain fatty acid transport protein